MPSAPLVRGHRRDPCRLGRRPRRPALLHPFDHQGSTRPDDRGQLGSRAKGLGQPDGRARADDREAHPLGRRLTASLSMSPSDGPRHLALTQMKAARSPRKARGGKRRRAAGGAARPQGRTRRSREAAGPSTPAGRSAYSRCDAGQAVRKAVEADRRRQYSCCRGLATGAGDRFAFAKRRRWPPCLHQPRPRPTPPPLQRPGGRLRWAWRRHRPCRRQDRPGPGRA
jgi:hypothetical protein